MKILCADYIVTCDDNFSIIKDGAICFEESIIEIGKANDVIKNNPYAIVKRAFKNSVIMPSMVNTHVHLEFSANKTNLIYGDFIKWLHSVLQYRDKLKRDCDRSCYEDAIEQMLLSGTLIFGAVSSFGDDLEACKNASQKVVYFNEILGSNPDMIDQIKKDLDNRVQKSFDVANEFFTPAISVHSPYSTHPLLAKYVIELAKRDDMVVSTHFMESRAEREWLDRAKGDFKSFLSFFNKNAKPMYDPIEFIEMFDGCKSLFVHCNLANDSELSHISKNGSISHCFISNRLLNNPLLDIKRVKNHDISLSIGTDGLSSNNSLNIWDELRGVLFAQVDFDLIELSRYLLLAATKNGALALGIEDSGSLKVGNSADLITIMLPDSIEDIEQLPLQLILHTKSVKSGYINGERCV